MPTGFLPCLRLGVAGRPRGRTRICCLSLAALLFVLRRIARLLGRLAFAGAVVLGVFGVLLAHISALLSVPA